MCHIDFFTSIIEQRIRDLAAGIRRGHGIDYELLHDAIAWAGELSDQPAADLEGVILTAARQIAAKHDNRRSSGAKTQSQICKSANLSQAPNLSKEKTA